MPEQINPIYGGRPEDFHYVGFGSGSGTNLVACAEVTNPAGIFSDRPRAKLLGLKKLAGIPKIVRSGFKACGSWEQAKGDPEAEAEYERRSIEFNRQILEDLSEFERKHGTIDLIVLGGYMRLILDPLLYDFRDKIINIHPSHLPVVDGVRRYVGDAAVYDAIKSGERVTRSSVIIVDDQVDHGEVLVQGPRLRVWGEFLKGSEAEREECAKEYADAHQSMQKVRSDWRALTTALKMISEGRIAIGTEKVHHGEWRRVYVDGKAMREGGYQLAA